MIPVFDLKSNSTESMGESIPNNSNMIARWDERKLENRKFRKFIFSDYSGTDRQIYSSASSVSDGSSKLLTYERFLNNFN